MRTAGLDSALSSAAVDDEGGHWKKPAREEGVMSVFGVLELGGGKVRGIVGEGGGGSLYRALSNWVSVDMMDDGLFGADLEPKRMMKLGGGSV